MQAFAQPSFATAPVLEQEFQVLASQTNIPQRSHMKRQPSNLRCQNMPHAKLLEQSIRCCMHSSEVLADGMLTITRQCTVRTCIARTSMAETPLCLRPGSLRQRLVSAIQPYYKVLNTQTREPEKAQCWLARRVPQDQPICTVTQSSMPKKRKRARSRKV